MDIYTRDGLKHNCNSEDTVVRFNNIQEAIDFGDKLNDAITSAYDVVQKKYNSDPIDVTLAIQK